MRRRILAILSLLLILVMVFTMPACRKDGGKLEVPEDDTSEIVDNAGDDGENEDEDNQDQGNEDQASISETLFFNIVTLKQIEASNERSTLTFFIILSKEPSH